MAQDRPNSELLRFLAEFYDSRNLISTANRLGKGSATCFRLLAQAREIFEDPLFVKSGRAMMPTPKMDSLIGEIQSILMRIDRLPSPKVFSPKELTQDFRIGCIDNAALRFIVPSLANLYAQAPNIRLSIISLHEHFQWALEKGNIDIVIYAPPNLKLRELGKKFHYETLYNTDHVYVVRNTHPLAIKLREGKQLKRSDLKNYRFIAVKYGYSEGKITTDFSGFEEGSNIAIDTPYLLTVPHMLTQCDLIGRLPESSVKELIGNLPLTILPKNLVADPAWTPVFLWHDLTHFDPAHQWFRSVLLRSLEEKRAKKRQESKKSSNLFGEQDAAEGWLEAY